VPFSASFAYPRWRPVLQTARQLCRREKIFLGMAGKALFEGRLMRRLQRERLLAAYLVVTYGMEIAQWRGRIWTARRLRRVLREAARVIVINEQMRRELARWGIARARLIKLTPGVADFFLEQPPPPRAGIAQNAYILAVGRLVSRKGFDDLLRAVAIVKKEFPRLRLHLVGDGPERENLERLARRLGIGRAVKFCGRLSREDLRRQYDGAALFALTPRRQKGQVEGFGIVYLEAAARGLAAVGTATGGVGEAVLAGKTGLLAEEGKAQSIAQALLALLRRPSLARKMAAAAQKRAREQFRWETRARQFEALVRRLAKSAAKE
jgi:phosphatidylinositol alpha-1,6-mannosyltransferase